jgi:hypothetical protein
MALRGMASQIVRTDVCLGLDDFTGQIAPAQLSNENLAQEIGCNVQCGS